MIHFNYNEQKPINFEEHSNWGFVSVLYCCMTCSRKLIIWRTFIFFYAPLFIQCTICMIHAFFMCNSKIQSFRCFIWPNALVNLITIMPKNMSDWKWKSMHSLSTEELNLHFTSTDSTDPANPGQVRTVDAIAFAPHKKCSDYWPLVELAIANTRYSQVYFRDPFEIFEVRIHDYHGCERERKTCYNIKEVARYGVCKTFEAEPYKWGFCSRSCHFEEDRFLIRNEPYEETKQSILETAPAGSAFEHGKNVINYGVSLQRNSIIYTNIISFMQFL